MAIRYENRDLPPIQHRPRPGTANRRAKVLDLWNNTGLTSSQIAQRLGTTQTTVTTDLWVLKNRGAFVKSGKGRRPKPEKPKPYKMIAVMEVAEARRQYAAQRRREGAKITEIADELGVHFISVSRYLKTLRDRGEI